MMLLADSVATVPSVSSISGPEIITTSLNMVTQFTIVGGAFWAVWGVIVLAGGLKDKNGPALQSGIWQLVGGALIMVAAAVFQTVIKIY